jgi:cbb3-type cytochrome oxidase maturation protein
MEVLYVIVPLAVAFAGGALLAYIWAVKSGQFDDMTTPASRVIVDDE